MTAPHGRHKVDADGPGLPRAGGEGGEVLRGGHPDRREGRPHAARQEGAARHALLQGESRT